MKATLVTIALLGALAGCGGGDNASPSVADVETQLPTAIEHNNSGSTLTDVRCIERSTRSFRCVGDYRSTREAVKKSMRGIDTSNFKAADWDALVRQQSGSASFDVDVAKDGSFVYVPTP